MKYGFTARQPIGADRVVEVDADAAAVAAGGVEGDETQIERLVDGAVGLDDQVGRQPAILEHAEAAGGALRSELRCGPSG